MRLTEVYGSGVQAPEPLCLVSVILNYKLNIFTIIAPHNIVKYPTATYNLYKLTKL